MERGGNVEFLPDDAGPEPDEDVVELGRRRQPPGWSWLIAAVLVAASVVAVVLTRHHPDHPASAVTPSPGVANSAAPSLGGVLATAPLAVAVAGRTRWVLQPGRITVLDELTSRRAGRSFSLHRPDPDSSQALILDPNGAVLWVVVESSTVGQVIEFDAATLRLRRNLALPAITSAAALDGHLYVTSGARLLDIAPSGAVRVVATFPGKGDVGPVAADPTRSRLLVVTGGFPSRLWTYRPGGKPTLTPGSLAFGKGSIAVAGGAIWVGGYAQTGAALLRLGARSAPSLSPVAVSPLEDALGPGALIVAGGRRVFWVRDGSNNDDMLWCVDAATGRVAQHWNVDGAVASTTGTALVATVNGVLPLQLKGCAG